MMLKYISLQDDVVLLPHPNQFLVLLWKRGGTGTSWMAVNMMAL